MTEGTTSPRRRWLLAGTVALLLVICLCLTVMLALPSPRQTAVSGDVTAVTGTPRPTATVRPSDTPLPTATPLPGVGDVVALPGITWRVGTAENLGGKFFGDRPDADPLTTSGAFVRLLVEVGNTGREPFSIPEVRLLDGAGREFTRSSDASYRIPSENFCGLDILNPGLVRTCEMVFEVPTDATGLLALVKEPGPFADRLTIDLGLP